MVAIANEESKEMAEQERELEEQSVRADLQETLIADGTISSRPKTWTMK